MKIPERNQWRRPEVFIVEFEHVSNLVVLFLLLILRMFLFLGLDEYNTT